MSRLISFFTVNLLIVHTFREGIKFRENELLMRHVKNCCLKICTNGKTQKLIGTKTNRFTVLLCLNFIFMLLPLVSILNKENKVEHVIFFTDTLTDQ